MNGDLKLRISAAITVHRALGLTVGFISLISNAVTMLCGITSASGEQHPKSRIQHITVAILMDRHLILISFLKKANLMSHYVSATCHTSRTNQSSSTEAIRYNI